MMKQENKYALPLGSKRYRVEFCDEAEAIRLAAAEGWTEGASLFDYIDPIANDAHRVRAFKTLEGAVDYAKRIAPRDVFRSPEIDELELRLAEPRDHIREWGIARSWVFDLGEELIEREAA